MASYIRTKAEHILDYIRSVGKHLLLALITGIIGGLIGAAFHWSLEFANETFAHNTWLIWLLPLGGLVIVGLYTAAGMLNSAGTDDVIDSIRSGKYLRFIMAPLIFVCTFLTHLLGGSAGREGAALQLGGSLGVQCGRLLSLDKRDMHVVTLCGMSAFFSALFCTPLTAVFFAIEVISVGVMYYAALLPCMASALLSFAIARWFGAEPLSFTVTTPTFSADLLWRVAILAALCAVLSVVFCLSMRETSRLFKRVFKNPFIRIVIGGVAIILLTLICGTHDYSGAGMGVVARAINEGTVVPTAFIWKILFTAITIGCGYKGGEIVPTMFIGATFGCLAGNLLGLDPGFAAAIGLVAVFCGAVNCPVTSIILSVELFGTNSLLLFAVACIISYILSGNFSLYHAQKIVYSKLRMEWINQTAK